jgi:hypothetical protein
MGGYQVPFTLTKKEHEELEKTPWEADEGSIVTTMPPPVSDSPEEAKPKRPIVRRPGKKLTVPDYGAGDFSGGSRPACGSLVFGVVFGEGGGA